MELCPLQEALANPLARPRPTYTRDIAGRQSERIPPIPKVRLPGIRKRGKRSGKSVKLIGEINKARVLRDSATNRVSYELGRALVKEAAHRYRHRHENQVGTTSIPYGKRTIQGQGDCDSTGATTSSTCSRASPNSTLRSDRCAYNGSDHYRSAGRAVVPGEEVPKRNPPGPTLPGGIEGPTCQSAAPRLPKYPRTPRPISPIPPLLATQKPHSQEKIAVAPLLHLPLPGRSLPTTSAFPSHPPIRKVSSLLAPRRHSSFRIAAPLLPQIQHALTPRNLPLPAAPGHLDLKKTAPHTPVNTKTKATVRQLFPGIKVISANKTPHTPSDHKSSEYKQPSTPPSSPTATQQLPTTPGKWLPGDCQTIDQRIPVTQPSTKTPPQSPIKTNKLPVTPGKWLPTLPSLPSNMDNFF